VAVAAPSGRNRRGVREAENPLVPAYTQDFLAKHIASQLSLIWQRR
jgi:hypothetical protein